MKFRVFIGVHRDIRIIKELCDSISIIQPQFSLELLDADMDQPLVARLCRLCATGDIDSNSAENSSLAENHERKTLLSLVNRYLRIAVTDCESLPQNFCADCIHTLYAFDSFAQKCLKVQDTLNSLSLLEPFAERLDSDGFNSPTSFCEDSKSLSCAEEDIKYIGDHLNDGYHFSSYQSAEKGAKTLDEKQISLGKSSLFVPPIRIRAVPRGEVKVDLSGISPCESNIHYEIQENETNNAASLRESTRTRTKSQNNNEKNEDLPDIFDEMKDEQKSSRKNPFAVFEFKCHVCEETFKNFSILKRHCKKEHDESAFVKCVCGKQLRARTAIIEHKRKHTGTFLFKCDTCGKTFNRRSLLYLHEVSHKPKDEQPFVCCKCAKRFHTSSLLKKHEKVHLPEEERFLDACHLCEKKFTSKSAVNAHLRAVHYGEKPFICEQCGHSYSSKAILTDHLTTHSEHAPWPCEVCGRNFKSKYRLNVHMDMHRTVKYSCPHCSMELSTRRTLRMHLLVHKEEKAYVCQVCSKAFRRSKDLKNHNNLHTGLRPYTCEFCPRTFANGSNCRAHKLRMHPAELGVEKNCRNYSCKPKVSTATDQAESSDIVDPNVSQPMVMPEQNPNNGLMLTDTIKNAQINQYSKYEFQPISPEPVQSICPDLDYSSVYPRCTNLNTKKEVFIQEANVSHLNPYGSDSHAELSKMHFLFS